MAYTSKKIAEFKSKGRNFISYRKKLNPLSIKKYFYNGTPLDVLYPNIDIKYCNIYMYNVTRGDFKLGIKYVNETGTYYMFIGANTFYAPAHEIAIGKAVDGMIYLLVETLTQEYNYALELRTFRENCIDKKDYCYRPISYNKHFFFTNETNEKGLISKDVFCVNTAYEGIKAFNALLSQFSK